MERASHGKTWGQIVPGRGLRHQRLGLIPGRLLCKQVETVEPKNTRARRAGTVLVQLTNRVLDTEVSVHIKKTQTRIVFYQNCGKRAPRNLANIGEPTWKVRKS